MKKIVKFEACSMETTQIYSVEWEYAEFDKVPASRACGDHTHSTGNKRCSCTSYKMFTVF